MNNEHILLIVKYKRSFKSEICIVFILSACWYFERHDAMDLFYAIFTSVTDSRTNYKTQQMYL